MATETADNDLTTDNILDVLNSDDSSSKDKSDEFDLSVLDENDEDSQDEPKEESEKERSEEEEEEEELDLKEKEDDEKEPNLEDEDELELSKIPKRAEIKAAYPDIFKKFPQLERALYREHAYAEVFSSVADAKEAKETLEDYNGFQTELLNGNISGVLKSVKATDPKAFDKIAQGLLDSLVRVDPNSHLYITTQVTKGVLNSLNQMAKNSLKKIPDDRRAQQLEIATELIHDALFNTNEVTPYRAAQTEEQENPEQARLNRERSEFEKSRFTAAFQTVSGKTNSIVKNSIAKNIDPKNILTPYVKNTLVKDVLDECDKQMMQDSRFKGLIDKLWLKAQSEGYSDDALNKIQTALKEKARTILPSIMRAKKAEAMKGSSSIKKPEKRELSRNTNGDRTSQKNESLTRSRKESDRNKPQPGESIMEFLSRD